MVAAEAELGGRGKAARRSEGAAEKKQENAAGRGFLAARQRKKTKKRGGGLGEIFLMNTEPKARRAQHEEGDNSDFLGDGSDGGGVGITTLEMIFLYEGVNVKIW